MKQNDFVPLSDQVQSIILGSLLGDGSLTFNKGYANARFTFRHSQVQEEYFQWKAIQLKEISSDRDVFLQNPDGYSKNNKLRYQSKALPSLTFLYKETYKHNRLRIRRKWLNTMTPLSLAIWWCDDGSLISNSRKGVFCTDGFDKESVQLLSQYFKVVWKVETHCAPIGRKRDGKKEEYWRLWIRSTDELKKFLTIILPYIPVASMLQKALLLYNDQHLQQRWISEVVTLTHFSEEVVQQQLEEKRTKWKRFRE